MQLVTLIWSQCSFTILRILEPLRIMLNLLCLCFTSGTRKPGWRHVCLQHGLLSILSTLLTLLLIDNEPDHPRGQMGILKINVFIPLVHDYMLYLVSCPLSLFNLLVGLKIGIVTMENSMEIPQKIKNRTTLWPSNSTSGFLSKEI